MKSIKPKYSLELTDIEVEAIYWALEDNEPMRLPEWVKGGYKPKHADEIIDAHYDLKPILQKLVNQVQEDRKIEYKEDKEIEETITLEEVEK
jgi:hypothetical protein